MKKYSDNGAKKCFVTGIVENMPENYENVKCLLKELGTQLFSFIIGDNKIIRILYGMQSCAATFSCCWCHATAPYDKPSYKLRTFKSLKENSEAYQKFLAESSDKKRQNLKHIDLKVSQIHP